MKKNLKQQDVGEENITTVIKKTLTTNECKNTTWTRNCPNCKKIVFHKNKYERNSYNKSKRFCTKCLYEIRLSKSPSNRWEFIDGKKWWVKNCPKCNGQMRYTSQSNLHKSNKKNIQCEECQYKAMRKYSKDCVLKVDRQRKKFLQWLNGHSNKFENYIGLTLTEFELWISSQFKSGMTWNNHGFETWHVDHKRPMSTFDFTNEDSIYQAWNFKNLRPLWAKDNLSKGAKWNIQ